MVVSEAQAIGLPIVTSRRVGAAECLPPAYEPWLAIVPMRRSSQSGRWRCSPTKPPAGARVPQVSRTRAAYDDRAYASATVATILAQKRRLK